MFTVYTDFLDQLIGRNSNMSLASPQRMDKQIIL